MRRTAFLLFLLVASHPASANEAMEDRQRVVQAIGYLMTWSLQPRAFMNSCEALDPKGAGNRLDLVEEWEKKTARLRDEISDNAKRALPILFPSLASAGKNAYVEISVHALINLTQQFVYLSDEKKADVCTNFSHYPFLAEPSPESAINPPLDYLKNWAAEFAPEKIPEEAK